MFVADPDTVDQTLELRCRAALVTEPRLEHTPVKNRDRYDDDREHWTDGRSSFRARRRSTSISPRHAGHEHRIGPECRSPSGRVFSHSSRRQQNTRGRSTSRSPPRKRIKSNQDVSEREALLRSIQKLRRERNMACELERSLHRELDLITDADEHNSSAFLQQQIDIWVGKAEQSGKQVQDLEQQICSAIDSHAKETSSVVPNGTPQVLRAPSSMRC